MNLISDAEFEFGIAFTSLNTFVKICKIDLQKIIFYKHKFSHKTHFITQQKVSSSPFISFLPSIIVPHSLMDYSYWINEWLTTCLHITTFFWLIDWLIDTFRLLGYLNLWIDKWLCVFFYSLRDGLTVRTARWTFI